MAKDNPRPLSFQQMASGEPDYIPEDGLFEMACCDCSLTHLMVLKHDSKGRHIIYAYRDDYMTSKFRALKRKQRQTRGRVSKTKAKKT